MSRVWWLGALPRWFALFAVVLVGSCGSPAATANALTFFGFVAGDNPGLVADATGTVATDAVDVVVPAGTDVHALVATFQTTGMHVQIGGVEQHSSETANDFSSPVTYTVIAGNGNAHAYTVTVTLAASGSKDLTAFAFLDATNSALSADVTATINGAQVAATVPFGTDVSALVATFTHSGVSVTVAGAPQTSGVTANSFASPVVYQVTAADGSTRDYTMTVTVAPSPAKDLTAFSFLDATNPALAADVTATINGTQVAATVPRDGCVRAGRHVLDHRRECPRRRDTPGQRDHAERLHLCVATRWSTGEDATKSYTVTVTIVAGTSQGHHRVLVPDATNPALSADVTATINGTRSRRPSPRAPMSPRWSRRSPHRRERPRRRDPADQRRDPNDFTNPVSYVVTAGDISTQTYTVTVTIAPSPRRT